MPCRRPYVPYLCMLVKIAATSYVGLQRFCRISRQSSPVAYTFGWNIWLMNLTAGGLFGYCSSKCITRRNVPSSNGVSAGPIMTAFLTSESALDHRKYPGASGASPTKSLRCRERVMQKRQQEDLFASAAYTKARQSNAFTMLAARGSLPYLEVSHQAAAGSS